jgi:gluconate kinase
MRKEIDFSKIPEGDAMATYVFNRWKKGLFPVVKLIGLSGTGKSYASVRMAQKVKQKIIEEDNGRNLYDTSAICPDDIVTDLLGLIRAIRFATKKGKIVVIEEVSTLFNTRRAMAGDNVDIGKILDTARKKGMILFANYPINKTADSHFERMCCMEIQTMKLLKKKGICIVKPMILQTNPATAKTYHHYVHDNNGNEIAVSYLKAPEGDVMIEYEKKKDKFMDDLYERLEHRQVKKLEKENKDMGKPPVVERVSKPLTAKELDVYNECMVNGKTMSQYAREHAISATSVFNRLKKVKNKVSLPSFSPKLALKTISTEQELSSGVSLET